MKKTFFLLFAVIVNFSQIVTAQGENEDTVKYTLPSDIVITAPRLSIPLYELPFATGLVDRVFLKTTPRSLTMDEALKLTPGVRVDNQANGNRLHMSIRGQGILTERGIRGIRILLDGIPINDPTGFAPDFFDVDLNTVERIEVLRGNAASLYGASSSGGIINITTQNSPDVPLFGDGYGIFGSNNYWKLYGMFGGNVDDVNYRVSVSRVMGDGYRVHTHFWGDVIYGRADYAPTKNIRLTPIFGYTHYYHENPEGINQQQYEEDPKQANPDAVPYNEFLETARSTGGLTGSILFGKSEIQFNGYVKTTNFTEANNHTFNYRDFTTPGTSVQYTLKTYDSRDLIKNKVGAGVDLQWQTINEHRVANNYSVPGDSILSQEKIEQEGLGLFLIDQLAIGDEWSIMLSLRYDKINNKLTDELKNPFDLSGEADFSKTTGRIGVTYSPNKKIDFYANWGQGFLPPATEELAQNPDNFGGFNTHLTSATSSGFELGARSSPISNLYLDLAGFFLATENDFNRYRITDSLRSQETFYSNAGSTNRWGIELYGKYTPIRNLDIQLAYTYSNFQYTNTDSIKIPMDDPSIQKYIVDGNYLPDAPMNQLYVDVQYNFLHGFFVALATETSSQVYIDGANIESEAAPGYTLINARLGYNWQIGGFNGSIMFSGRNIAGTTYIAFTEPDPGGNAYQPGPSSEFFIDTRIRF
jgi:iron complex outermembrane recepter protein